MGTSNGVNKISSLETYENHTGFQFGAQEAQSTYQRGGGICHWQNPVSHRQTKFCQWEKLI